MARFLCVAVLFASACVVGEPTTSAPNEEVDAGGGGGGGGDGGGMAAQCEPAATNLPNGHHNAGTACLSCHNGTTAVRFRVAGTLYASAQGGGPVSGATIVVKDAMNVTAKLITAADGNFYTSDALTPPFTVKASKCPSTDKAMPGTANSGDCNSCHQANTTGRIFLP